MERELDWSCRAGLAKPQTWPTPQRALEPVSPISGVAEMAWPGRRPDSPQWGLLLSHSPTGPFVEGVVSGSTTDLDTSIWVQGIYLSGDHRGQGEREGK